MGSLWTEEREESWQRYLQSKRESMTEYGARNTAADAARNRFDGEMPNVVAELRAGHPEQARTFALLEAPRRGVPKRLEDVFADELLRLLGPKGPPWTNDEFIAWCRSSVQR